MIELGLLQIKEVSKEECKSVVYPELLIGDSVEFIFKGYHYYGIIEYTDESPVITVSVRYINGTKIEESIVVQKSKVKLINKQES